MTIFFLMAAGRKVNLKERSLLMEANNTFHIGGAVKFVKRVLIGTAIFELAGALFLPSVHPAVRGSQEAHGLGIFHAISAFLQRGL